jgi:hypothetical protein
VEGSEATELEEGMSGLEKELAVLAELEQSALGRKKDAEERLRSLTGQDIGEHLAEASSGLAASRARSPGSEAGARGAGGAVAHPSLPNPSSYMPASRRSTAALAALLLLCASCTGSPSDDRWKDRDRSSGR